MQRLSQLDRVAVTSDVHVENRHGRSQQMIVDRGDLNPIGNQSLHDRADLGVREHQVAHEHRPIAGGQKGNPGAQRQCGFDSDTVDCHGQVRSRQTIFVRAAGLIGALPADGLIHLSPINRGRHCRKSHCKDSRRCHPGRDAFHTEFFQELGSQWVARGRPVVSLVLQPVAPRVQRVVYDETVTQ